MTFEYFQHAVEGYGLKAVQKSETHFQILGGKVLVNFYPNAKKGPVVYVAGTAVGHRADLSYAIRCAGGEIKHLPRTQRRKGGYKKYKVRLLRKYNKCYWCPTLLTLETATIDHKVPLALGGLNNENNYVLACLPCNSKKGHSMWDAKEFQNGDASVQVPQVS